MLTHLVFQSLLQAVSCQTTPPSWMENVCKPILSSNHSEPRGGALLKNTSTNTLPTSYLYIHILVFIYFYMHAIINNHVEN